MTEEEIRQFFKTKREERGWNQSKVGDKLYKLGVLVHGKRLPYEVGKKTTKNYYKVHRIERGKDVLALKDLVALAKVFNHEVIIRPKIIPKVEAIEGAERMMNFMLGAKNELGQGR